MELVTRTAKLIPYTKHAKAIPGFATAYYYEPEPGVRTELGNLYVVIEVLSPAKLASEVADLVIKSLGEAYYNAPNDNPIDPAKRFEAAVKVVNRELADFTEQGNGSWVGRMSAVIAVFAGGHLYLSQTGSAEAFLYRGQVPSQISEGLSPKGPHRPETTFTQFASGQLEERDKLLFTTPALLHQINRQSLNELVMDSGPSLTAQKISELISRHENADRIAALIVEVTTASLLAMQVRSEEPESVQVGTPESKLDVARVAAAPVARKVSKGLGSFWRRISGAARQRLLPALKSAGLRIVQRLRRTLQRPGGLKKLGSLIIVIVVAASGLVWWHNSSEGISIAVKQFDVAAGGATQAKQMLDQGNKAGAKATLAKVAPAVDSLAHSPKLDSLNRILAKNPAAHHNLSSLAALQAEITIEEDRIEGVVQIPVKTLADLSGIQGTKPNLIAEAGGKLLLAGNGNQPTLSVYSLTTAKLEPLNPPSGLGQPVAMATNSSGDGIFILTSQPSVWSFRASDNSLSQISLSFGDWPTGKAIASYGGNIYILSDSQIWRFTPTLAGFSAKNGYLPSEDSTLSQADTLTVDGSILTAGSFGLRRYLLGKMVASAPNLPSSLLHPKSLQSLANGSILLADGNSGRIGVISLSGQVLSLSKQFSLKNLNQLTAAVSDPKTNLAYIINGSQLDQVTLSF